MNTGVYCKQKDSTKIYNSILIDEYHKCIFGLPAVESEGTVQSMSAMKISEGSSQEEEKWEVGTNVRAPFSEDGEYYEAVIERILDRDYAVVRFLGYENEEAVKIKLLRPSRGEESIKEQLAQVELDQYSEEYDEDYEDYDNQEIEWKPGMHCRALYAPNEVIYEATVQEVKKSKRKAVVVMAGYDVSFEVNFDDMYESIPDLRIKQKKNALKHRTENRQKPQPVPGVSIPPPLPGTSFQASDSHHGELNFANPDVNSSSVFSQHQGMMQPQTENDALACLVSSNYLSGYYAGFYDCLRKLQNQRNT